jgi:hypothetical protein
MSPRTSYTAENTKLSLHSWNCIGIPCKPNAHVFPHGEKAMALMVLPLFILSLSTYWTMLRLCWVIAKSQGSNVSSAKSVISPQALFSGWIWFQCEIGDCWYRKTWEEQTQLQSQLYQNNQDAGLEAEADCWLFYDLGGSVHRAHN